jgi:hypothetical protein
VGIDPTLPSALQFGLLVSARARINPGFRIGLGLHHESPIITHCMGQADTRLSNWFWLSWVDLLAIVARTWRIPGFRIGLGLHHRVLFELPLLARATREAIAWGIRKPAFNVGFGLHAILEGQSRYHTSIEASPLFAVVAISLNCLEIRHWQGRGALNHRKPRLLAWLSEQIDQQSEWICEGLAGQLVILNHSKTFTFWNAKSHAAKWFVSAVREHGISGGFWNDAGQKKKAR